MTAALVIGKFYPPHAGHLRLVHAALGLRDHVVVLCLGSKGDTYRPDARAAALTADLAATGVGPAQVTVVGGYDEAPFDLDDAGIWLSHEEVIRCYAEQAVGARGFDLLVTSETYGDELAGRLGVAHRLVDVQRAEVPVSATAVRADVPAAWPLLGPGTRAMLGVRIVVLGAESTGTTTVATALAATLRARGGPWAAVTWVPEYGRELTLAKQDEVHASTGRRPLTVPWSAADFDHVVTVQSAREQEALTTAGPVLVCDTDAFATTIWERRYLGAGARLDPSSLGTGDVYLLTDHRGVPFVQDGIRDGEEVRVRMTADFQEALTRHRRPWVLLSGNLDRRLALAERVVDQVCRQRWTFTAPV